MWGGLHGFLPLGSEKVKSKLCCGPTVRLHEGGLAWILGSSFGLVEPQKDLKAWVYSGQLLIKCTGKARRGGGASGFLSVYKFRPKSNLFHSHIT